VCHVEQGGVCPSTRGNVSKVFQSVSGAPYMTVLGTLVAGCAVATDCSGAFPATVVSLSCTMPFL